MNKIAMRRAAATVATAGTILAVTAGAAHSAPRPGPARVTGTVQFALPYSPDDDVRTFSFDARATPYTRPIPGLPTGSPADATGTVRVSHLVQALHRTVTLEAAVDCMITTPSTATLTAIVTRADSEVADWVGHRIGFSVQDGGRRGPDRVGFTWTLSGDQDDAGVWGPARVGTCLAPAAFAPVTRGDVTVRYAELTPPPASR